MNSLECRKGNAMPKVKPLVRKDNVQYNKDLMIKRCKLLMWEYNIKNKDICQLTGLSPSYVSEQFSQNKMTFDVYIAVQMLVAEKTNTEFMELHNI